RLPGADDAVAGAGAHRRGRHCPLPSAGSVAGMTLQVSSPSPAARGATQGSRGQASIWLSVALMAAVLAYPLLLSSYQMDVARDALIFALLALSLDFLWGKAGVL